MQKLTAGVLVAVTVFACGLKTVKIVGDVMTPTLKDGLPGEALKITGGSVSINGVPLPEPDLAAGTQTTAPQTDYSVPSSSYFVLSDNRSHMGGDSRSFGPVPRAAIQGKVG